MAIPITSNLLKLYLDASIVAYSTDFSEDFSWDTIEIAKLGSGGAKEFIVSDYSWSGSLSAYVLKDSTNSGEKGLKEILTKAKTRLPISFKYVPDVSSNMYVDGSAYITGLSITGATGAAMTFSCDFQGTGDFTISTTA
jgi:hypothetical protein